MPRPSRRNQTRIAPTAAPAAGIPSPSPGQPAADGSPSTTEPVPSTLEALSGTPETFIPAAPPPPPDIALSVTKRNTPDEDAVHLSRQQERDTRDLAIIDALQRGVPYRQICAEHQIGLGSLSRLAQRLDDMEREGVAKLMALKSLDALEHWERSMKIAADSGKHTPAKDWLLHARSLEPVQQEQSQGAKVAIIIGTPDTPVSVIQAQVVDSKDVSSE